MKKGGFKGQGSGCKRRYGHVTADMKKVATLYGADVHPAEV